MFWEHEPQLSRVLPNLISGVFLELDIDGNTEKMISCPFRKYCEKNGIKSVIYCL